MPVIESKIMINTKAFKKNAEDHTKLIDEFDVKSINKYHFYYPNYNEEHLIFGNNEIHNETIAFHFCQNYLSKYLNQYDETLIEKKPTCLFDLYIHQITHQINSTIHVENYDSVTTINEKTIYVILEPPSLSDLHTLCRTKNLFLQDIHFFIFNQEYSLNDIENYILYYDIYDIKTFENISDADKIEIISHYYDPCKIIIQIFRDILNNYSRLQYHSLYFFDEQSLDRYKVFLNHFYNKPRQFHFHYFRYIVIFFVFYRD